MKVTQLLKMMKDLSTKLKNKKAFIECLMSMNLPRKIVNYVVGNIISCQQKMIEFEKEKKRYQTNIDRNIVVLFHHCCC